VGRVRREEEGGGGICTVKTQKNQRYRPINRQHGRTMRRNRQKEKRNQNKTRRGIKNPNPEI
jgi:hypothetical protein